MLSSEFWVPLAVCHRLPDEKLRLDPCSVYVYTQPELYVHSRAVIRKLEAQGWYEVRQTGSHKQFRHDDRPGLVTVPHPKKELPIGTLKSISKVSGVPLP